MKRWALVLGVGFILGGCAQGLELGFTQDPNQKMFRFSNDKVAKMAKEDPYTLELASFVDARTPENFTKTVDDGVIYEYRPEALLSPMDKFLTSGLARGLKFGMQKDTVYKVDAELTNLRTYIETGSIFRGAYGGYVADVKMNVMIRDENANVLIEHPLHIRSTKYRRAIDGTHPSEAQDKKAMREVSANAMREAAVRIGWMAHTAFKFEEQKYE